MRHYAQSIHDIATLARTLYGEARGEGLRGIRACGHVVMNRLRDERWPETIAKVCLQPLQFSCWNGEGEARLNNLSFEDLRDALVWAPATAIALLYETDDPTNGANHYLTNKLFLSGDRPSWADPHKIVAVIGNHTFLKL